MIRFVFADSSPETLQFWVLAGFCSDPGAEAILLGFQFSLLLTVELLSAQKPGCCRREMANNKKANKK